jgi:hypothetical protein
MKGKKDDDLATRWVQYGVFSPIMRLHSTANPWNSKKPWNDETEADTVQTTFLQLRHKLLRCLKVMNIRSRLGEPLCKQITKLSYSQWLTSLFLQRRPAYDATVFYISRLSS